MIKQIIYVTILIGVFADSIPELKTSLDFQQLKALEQNILEPLINEHLVDIAIPLDILVEKKIPILGSVIFEAKEALLNYLTINWDDTNIKPLAEDTLLLQLSDVSVSLDIHLFAKIFGLKLINSPTRVIITNLDFSLTIRFDPSTKVKSWGFIPVITDNTISIEKVQIHIEKSNLPVETFDYILELLVPVITKHAPSLIQKYLAPALVKKSQKDRISFETAIGASNYKIGVQWTSPPRVIYTNGLPALSLALDLSFENTTTGTVCPHFDSGDLPDKVVAAQDLEVILGGNLIDQILWLMIDSKMLDATIDNSAIADSGLPIALTTSGLKLIIADFFDAYGADKGIYVRIYGKNPTQNLYVRNGRVLGAMSLMVDFIVDKDSSLYPQKSVSECTHCVVALTAEIQMGLMMTLYNLDNNHIGGQVILMKVVELIQEGGELTTVNPITVISTINSLVGGLLPSINGDLAQGIENPLIGKFTVNALNLVIGESFITAAISLDS